MTSPLTLEELCDRIEGNIRKMEPEMSSMTERQQALISLIFIDIGYVLEIMSGDVPGAEDDPMVGLARVIAQEKVDKGEW